MIEIIKIGEHTIHDSSFKVDRPNGHPVYLLLLVKTRSSFWVDNHFMPVEPDTAFLFLPGQKHLYHATEDTYIDSWAHLKIPDPVLDDSFPYGHPVPLPDPIIYHNLFHILCSEFYETNQHRDIIMHHLAVSLLQKINDAAHISRQKNAHYEFVRLRTQIYSNPAEDWNIEKIAAQLNVSVGYFHALYKKMFHTTCVKDVIRGRIEYAMELLNSTDKSISEISELCGYHYTEHFLRQFKSYTKTTPLQYRKSIFEKLS